jgi:uncharacterized protein
MDLTDEQVRVLGCLVEKEATTPDQYPLSTNALTLACNQKSNRDPIVYYSEREVDQVVLELREMGLARTVHAANARVPKHRHVLEEAWGLDAGQLALLGVMMLRGPNTVNELLMRTNRYAPFRTLEGLRASLASLCDREPALVVEIERQAGQREARFTHVLGGEPALESLSRPQHAAPAVEAPFSPQRNMPAEPVSMATELADLRRRVEALERHLFENR